MIHPKNVGLSVSNVSDKGLLHNFLLVPFFLLSASCPWNIISLCLRQGLRRQKLAYKHIFHFLIFQSCFVSVYKGFLRYFLKKFIRSSWINKLFRRYFFDVFEIREKGNNCNKRLFFFKLLFSSDSCGYSTVVVYIFALELDPTKVSFYSTGRLYIDPW